MAERAQIDIVIPVYNEARHIGLLYDELQKVLKPLETRYRFALVFVDDGSTDRSVEAIELLQDPRIALLRFSRNFGKEAALTAGLQHSTGDAVIILDADLQHPPHYLPAFIDAWQNGAQMVIGLRQFHNGGWTRRFWSWLYHAIAKRLSPRAGMPGCTDFRLIDREVVEAFGQLTEHDRLSRDLLDWIGFDKAYIPFEAGERSFGDSRYSFARLIHLALFSFVSNSLLPLKVAGYLGIVMMVFSLLIGSYTFVDRFVLGNQNFSGPFMTSVLNAFLTSLTLISLGLIGLYVGSIKNDTRARPLYILRQDKKTKEIKQQKSA